MTSVLTVEGSGHECDVKLDTWLRDILPHTPGAIRKVVKRELVNACREFYEQSFAWRVLVAPKTMRANKVRYSMSPYDAYTNIVGVMGVELEGQPLARTARQPRYFDRTADRPTHYWLESPDYVRLYPTPTSTLEDSLAFYVALTPKQSVTHLPRIALSHHYDAILDGTLGRLFSHPAKPYSNPSLAQYRLQRFRAAIGKYAALAKQGYAQAPSWGFPRFGK